MSTHTKGPWRIHAQAKTAVVGSTDFVVAACGGYSTNARDAGDVQDELEANARLIAMAPELLAIAQKLAKLREGLENGNSSAEWAATELAVKAGEVVARATGVTR